MNGSERYSSARRWPDIKPGAEIVPSADIPFPLTPALSPEERENARQRVGKSGASGMFERRSAHLPLPRGEGSGEGEQTVLEPHVPIDCWIRRT
jgi:hypothetical protein